MPNCMFCGTAKVSKEHLWGKWWKEYYPPSKEAMLSRDRHTITKLDSENNLVESKGQFSNSGAPISATTKVVCEKCNTTWMSQIENNMKKAFHSLYYDCDEVITPEISGNIKKWMYLKFCLLDRAYQQQAYIIPDKIISQQILSIRDNRWKEYYSNVEVPENYYCFIGRSDNKYKLGSFNHIPMIKMLKEHSIKIFLYDACLFFNGHFMGVLTNHEQLSKHLLNFNSNLDSNPFKLLGMGKTKFSNECVINGKQFENIILSELEKDRQNPYRRNFSKE